MQYSLFDLLKLAGALGLFIFGMKVMSEGIQKVAGNKLRSILGYMTTNRFSAVFTGFLTTSIIQSSSATTVMVVSFVNAGLLKLRQAIGVIMGANIGTTITAVLILIFGFSKFSIGSYTLPIIAIGFPLLFSKKAWRSHLGEFLIGFALLFMGLDFLKTNMPDLQQNPELLEGIQNLTEFGYLSVILFVLIGTLMTIVVQSSSAAMALTLVMVDQGWIPFELAAAIVLGENIGTTITANLAAMVGNAYAKRAARAHFIFNIMGVFWILIVYYPFLNGVAGFMKLIGQGNPFADTQWIKWGLTYFHIFFNIINTFLMVWFIGGIEKIVTRMVPVETVEDGEFRLQYISSELATTPSLAIQEAVRELSHFASKIPLVISDLPVLFRDNNEAVNDAIRVFEEHGDQAELELTRFVVELTEDRLSRDTSVKAQMVMQSIKELEECGNILQRMAKIAEKNLSAGSEFTEAQLDKLDSVNKQVHSLSEALVGYLSSWDSTELTTQKAASIALLRTVRESNGLNGPDVTALFYYRDLLFGYENLMNRLTNVGEQLTRDSILLEDSEVQK